MTEEAVRSALQSVKYPGFSRDIVSFGLVQSVEVRDDHALIRLRLQTRDPNIPERIVEECHAALDPLAGDPAKVRIEIDVTEPPEAPGAVTGKASVPGVKHVIAVASGKGGVGKSTVAANLAVALARKGLQTGLCDCDLYGPSIAIMFGATGQQPTADAHDRIIPLEAHGVQLMSMGFLVGDDSPVIVRGPLATRYTQQFLQQVAWRDLDVLLLDLPPGTGDIQLTIVQTVALAGAVVVTTPQEVALIDARKAASMFAKVNVPILGLIENMSWFECEHGARYHLFGDGGGVREAKRLHVPLLARVPLDPDTQRRGDSGQPAALLDPAASPVSQAFHTAAHSLLNSRISSGSAKSPKE